MNVLSCHLIIAIQRIQIVFGCIIPDKTSQTDLINRLFSRAWLTSSSTLTSCVLGRVRVTVSGKWARLALYAAAFAASKVRVSCSLSAPLWKDTAAFAVTSV